MYDNEFFNWFCKKKEDKMPERVRNIWEQYLSAGNNIEGTRGRKKLSIENQQVIFDLWHEHSIVTVDRRNGRDQIRIKK